MSIKNAALKLYFILRLPFIVILAIMFKTRDEKVAKRPGKILIIRLDRLGDLILTIPVIDNLKLYYPEAKVTILVRSYLQGLARLIRSIDEVMVYEGFFRTVRKLRGKGFDMVVDMLTDYRIKPAMLAILSGTPERIGFQEGFRGRFFTDVVPAGASGRSMVDIDLDIIRALGIPVKVKTPYIEIEKTKKDGKRTVSIHPGGHYPSQRWDPERFAAVARKISETYDVNVVIIGGPRDESSVELIMEHLKGCPAEPVFTDMEGLAFLLARSELLICNNSGPLHLAAALGIPTVSMMGPTDPELWRPKGQNHIVLRKNMACSPCSRGFCKEHECLKAITVDEVFDKVKAVLDGIDGIKRR